MGEKDFKRKRKYAGKFKNDKEKRKEKGKKK